MAKADSIINSFVNGELSPRLGGRRDIQQYYQSASSIKNMLVEFYGGAKKAPGTMYCAQAKSFTEIDLMEYATDALAQTAYVTDLGEEIYAQEVGNDSNIYLGSTTNPGLHYWAAQSVTLAVPQFITSLKVTFNASTGAPAGDATCRIETDNGGEPSGTLAHANATKVFTPVASAENTINFTDFKLAAGTYWIVLKCDDQAVNNRWNIAYLAAGTYAGGNLAYYESGSWVDIAAGDMTFKLYTLPLQSYTESVIKEQGVYSLNFIALDTSSLNGTLTRTLGTAIDLTDKDTLQFYVMASRTGGNFKVAIHDSDGTTSEKAVTIAVANTWEKVTWDISGVVNANKDDIDSIIITITNADADNIVYIDDFGELSSTVTRLIPFVFSDTQAYIIEAGHHYFRFYRDSGQILSGTVAYEIATSYDAEDLFDLQFAQTADILYITHPDYPQAKLTRTAHTAWTLTEIDFSTGSARPALMAENVGAITITPSAATGNITLTASAALFNALHVGSIWKVNTGYVKITAFTTNVLVSGTVLYGGTLTGTSAYTVWNEPSWSDYRGYPRSVTISEDRLIYGYTPYQPQTVWGSSTGAYDTFELGTDAADAFSSKTDTNQVEVINWLFPANEILIGTSSGVSSLGTGSDTTALTATTGRMKKKVRNGTSTIMPASIGNNVFYWEKYNRVLREYVYSLENDSFISNDATAFSDHITEGGIVDMAYQESPIPILWCVRADGKLLSFTRQIEHKVAAWAIHETDGEYESVAVIPLSTYDQVWVVVKRTIGGVDYRFIEYMVAPDFEDQEDMCFMHSALTLDSPIDIINITQANPAVVTATGHGLSNGDRIRIRGVEGMTELNYVQFKVANKTDNSFELTDLSDVDIDSTSYGEYEEGGEIRKCVNSVSGLDHLEGETVRVCVDGKTHNDCVVASGAITLDDYYSQVAAGLPYKSTMETNDLEVAPGEGSSTGKQKRVTAAVVNLYRSGECAVGTSTKTDTLSISRAASLPEDQATPLYTGPKRIPFPAGWDTVRKVVVESDNCLNLHILSVTSELEAN